MAVASWIVSDGLWELLEPLFDEGGAAFPLSGP
jgi:hypothetical protein